jgi:hypothetical protein
MVNVLLSHGWKKFTRSVSFTRNVATTVLVGIFGLMMVVYALGLGFALEVLIVKVLKQTDSISFLNSILLYYFGFEFIMRYMMQNMPVMDIQPYLHLPMKKSKMIHYLLMRSLAHVLNFLPLLIFTPFALKVIGSAYGYPVAWAWLISIWVCSLILHFLIMLFKKKLDDNIYGIVILLSVILLFGAADYFQWFKLSAVSLFLFSGLLQQPGLILLPMIVMIGLYFLNFRFFLQGTYPEEMAFQKNSTFNKSGDVSFLKNFGLIGEMINVEVKLILRNKRPRNILYLSAFFLLYGLIFYNNDKYMQEMSGILLFVGIFITGIFMINYGQLLFSWQGGHYDFTLTRPVSMRQYVESKYWLLSVITMICFVLSTPYVYFGWKILLIHLAMMLFNLGINVFVILNLSMWDPKKVDLQKGVTFNYEGVGAAQWIMSIPILLGPYLFYLPFSFAGYPTLGIIAVGLAGIIGITLRNTLIEMTTRRLMNRKYKIAAGFRKD